MSRRAQLLVFAAGVVFFAILVAQAGLHGLAAQLGRSGWLIPEIVGVWGLTYVCNTISWDQLIRATVARTGREGTHARIPFARGYAITVASFAINYSTPFVALGGEPFKLASAAQWIGTDRAATSVLSFRITHTLGQIIFWLIAVPIGWIYLPHTLPARLFLVIAAVVFAGIASFLFALARHGVTVRFLDTIRHVPIMRRLAPRLERFRPTLAHIDEQMSLLTDGEFHRFAAAAGFEVLGRAIAMVEFYLVAHAEGLHIGYPEAFFIGAFSQLAILILVFIPFELGSREGGLAAVYGLLGLSPALGVYAGVLTRLRELVWIAIGLTLVWVTGKQHSAGTPVERQHA